MTDSSRFFCFSFSSFLTSFLPPFLYHHYNSTTATDRHPSSKQPRSSSSSPIAASSSRLLLLILLTLFLLLCTTTLIRTPLSILLLHLRHHHHHQSSIYYNPPSPPITRSARVLFYWKPHKTGSTSVRSWLLSVAKILNVTLYKTPYYPYSEVRSHVEHLRYLALKNPKRKKDDRLQQQGMPHCAILAGHIRVPSVLSSTKENEKEELIRPDERMLGSILTSTRRSFDTLASKFFHRTGTNMTSPHQFLSTTTSSSSSSLSLLQHWRFHWHAVSPCEPLAYYDGIYDYNCNLSFAAIHSRAHAIAQRVDCVIDTNDFLPDLLALCAVMHIPQGKCPRFGQRRIKHYSMFYDRIKKVKEVMWSVRWHVYVMDVLRFYLRQRRCRYVLAPTKERSIAVAAATTEETTDPSSSDTSASTTSSTIRTNGGQTRMVMSNQLDDDDDEQMHVKNTSIVDDLMNDAQQQQQQVRMLRQLQQQQQQHMPKWPFPNCHLVEDGNG